MTPLFRLSGVVMLVGSTFLTGCFGYDRILFVTKTNVGLDVENKPPTAEITIARREIAIAPTFRDTTDGQDKTPPLIASFGRTGGLFTTGLTSNFAGGDAAISLANKLPPEVAGAETAAKTAASEGAQPDPGAARTAAIKTALAQAAVAKAAAARAVAAKAAAAEASGAEAAAVETAATKEANTKIAAAEAAEAEVVEALATAAQAVAAIIKIKDENSSIICLDKKPDPRPPLKKFWHWMTDWIGGRPDENTRVFYFATDTSFGLKLGWDGTGGPYPTDLKLGYNRKELAFPPIFIKPVSRGKCTFDKDNVLLPGIVEGEEGKEVEVKRNGEVVRAYEVTVPSFFASLDNESSLADRAKEQQLEPAVTKAAAAKATAVEAEAEAAAAKATAVEAAQPEAAAAEAAAEAAAAKATAAQAKAVEAAESLAVQQRSLNLKHVQFFATGKAATEWVKRKEVNEKAYKQMLGTE